MRNLSTVIDQLLIIIPAEQTDLRQELASYKESVDFAPPELHGQWWGEAARALYAVIGTPSDHAPDTWQGEVCRIWFVPV